MTSEARIADRGRLQEIIRVFTSVGFGDFFKQMGFEDLAERREGIAAEVMYHFSMNGQPLPFVSNPAGGLAAVPADGVLVVLPDPYTLLVHPVDGIGVVRAIERLRVHAARTDGLSSQVYWWHAERLTHIRADIIAQRGQTRLVVAPPPEFARVLARLAV